MASEIESLLEYALNIGASELIVTEGAPSAVRFAGRVCAVPESSALPFGSLLEFLGALDGESGTFVGGPWVNCRASVLWKNGLGDVLCFGFVQFWHFAVLRFGRRS